MKLRTYGLYTAVLERDDRTTDVVPIINSMTLTTIKPLARREWGAGGPQ